jgi:hypothetical protein
METNETDLQNRMRLAAIVGVSIGFSVVTWAFGYFQKVGLTWSPSAAFDSGYKAVLLGAGIYLASRFLFMKRRP